MKKRDATAINLIKSGLDKPFYIFDLKQISGQIKILKNTFANKAAVLFSIKSNPNIEVLSYLNEKYADIFFDVCSIGEIRRAMKAGISPKRMSFIGPGKTVDEIVYSIKNNVQTLVVESEQELEYINKISMQLRKTTNIILRLALKETISIAGGLRKNHPTHFGIAEDQAMILAQKFNQNKEYNFVKLKGIHCYVQSNYLEADKILSNFKSGISAFKKISNIFGTPMEILNLGGGFGIDYFDGQKPLDMKIFKEKWVELKKHELGPAFNKVQIQVESGRFLMAEAGTFYCQILYIKECYEKNFIVLNGGLTQNMSATGFGQIIRRNLPIRLLNKKDKEHSFQNKKYDLVGPSCYSMDIMGKDVEIKNVKPGDIVAIDKCGAYGMSFSPNGFLLRPKPKEFCVK